MLGKGKYSYGQRLNKRVKVPVFLHSYLTFRALGTRYRAKSAVGLFEGDMLHFSNKASE